MTKTIMRRLAEHHEVVKKHFPNVFVTVLIGSQTIGLHHANSDIDSKSFYFPSQDDILLGKDIKPRTFRFEDGLCTAFPISYLPRLLSKPSFDSLQLVFSKWAICGKYQHFWEELVSYRQVIAHHSPRDFIMSALGSAKQYIKRFKDKHEAKVLLKIFYLDRCIDAAVDSEFSGDFDEVLQAEDWIRTTKDYLFLMGEDSLVQVDIAPYEQGFDEKYCEYKTWDGYNDGRKEDCRAYLEDWYVALLKEYMIERLGVSLHEVF